MDDEKPLRELKIQLSERKTKYSISDLASSQLSPPLPTLFDPNQFNEQLKVLALEFSSQKTQTFLKNIPRFCILMFLLHSFLCLVSFIVDPPHTHTHTLNTHMYIQTHTHTQRVSFPSQRCENPHSTKSSQQ
jgi:hypothetical protein